MAVTYEHIHEQLYGKDGNQPNLNLEVSLAYIPMSGPRFKNMDKMEAFLKQARTQTVPEGSPNAGELVKHYVGRIDLEGRDIAGAHLPGATIMSTLMNNANLDEITYTGGEFRGDYMAGASMKSAKLDGVVFKECNCEGADFTGADLSNSEFIAPVLQNAVFKNATLLQIDLSGQDLRGVDFTGAVMTGMNLRGADLRGAIFDGADMSGVDMSAARMDLSQLAHVAKQPAIGPAGRLGPQRLRRMRPGFRP